MWKQCVELWSTCCGYQLVVALGCYCALSGSDCLLPFLWDPDTPHYPSSLWLPTGSPPCEDTDTQTPCIFISINNCEDTIALLCCEALTKWAMSKLLAHYTRKQLSGGETETIPNHWQFAFFDTRRPNPHPQPKLPQPFSLGACTTT